MSVIASLKKWLQDFDGGVITTDILLLQTPAKAVSASSTGNVVLDILGNRTYSNNYIFKIRSLSLDEADREDNYDLLSNLTNWIYDRNYQEDYPILEKGIVEEIKVTNDVLTSINDDGTSEYEILLTMKIFEKKERRK